MKFEAPRFTLRVGSWYAMQFMGDDFGMEIQMAMSPIRVDHVKPLKTGRGEFDLGFFHANYPEGVQGKEYQLRTIHRGQTFMIAQSLEGGGENPRFLHLTHISPMWLNLYFPDWDPLNYLNFYS